VLAWSSIKFITPCLRGEGGEVAGQQDSLHLVALLVGQVEDAVRPRGQVADAAEPGLRAHSQAVGEVGPQAAVLLTTR
jgi:hypothetical protein